MFLTLWAYVYKYISSPWRMKYTHMFCNTLFWLLLFQFLRSPKSLRWPIDIVLDILTITSAFPLFLHSQHHVYNRFQLLVKSPGRHLNNYHRCRHSRRICISENSWRRKSKSGYPANQHKNYSSVRIHNMIIIVRWNVQKKHVCISNH